jgi:electron transfer flavoprotein beta subunit
VPDATAHKRIDAGTKRLDRSGEGALNTFDANAVEEALRLKDATGDGEVVVVSMGPERALNSLRKALAMGADRAVLIADEGAAGPISSPRASRSGRHSSASSPTSSSSGSSRRTRTAPCSGQRWPSGSSGR